MKIKCRKCHNLLCEAKDITGGFLEITCPKCKAVNVVCFQSLDGNFAGDNIWTDSTPGVQEDYKTYIWSSK